jgi:hypothetical protein
MGAVSISLAFLFGFGMGYMTAFFALIVGILIVNRKKQR